MTSEFSAASLRSPSGSAAREGLAPMPLLLIGVVFAVAIGLRQVVPLNTDVSWLLVIGERMLDGQRLYRDLHAWYGAEPTGLEREPNARPTWRRARGMGGTHVGWAGLAGGSRDDGDVITGRPRRTVRPRRADFPRPLERGYWSHL